MYIKPRILNQLRNAAGKENVFTDEISLALNAYDCSLSRTRPDAVVQIRREENLRPVLQILAENNIPFVPKAASTNHAGSCAAVHGGVILNLNSLNQIIEINTREGWADVQPGVITGDLQNALDPLGFFYAPDPASVRICTLGGNLAQNASGARCMKYGGTQDHVLKVWFITPDGKEHTLSRQDAGPDLIGLLAGSEGTLGVIKRLRVRILPQAKHIKTFLVTFPALENAVQAVSDLVASGITPRCVEAMDKITTQAIEGFARAGYPTDAEALLIIELDGEPKQISKHAKILESVCHQNACETFQTARTEAEREKLWQGRRAAFAAMARLAPNVLVGDGTVPRSELPSVVKKIRAVLDRYGLFASLLFHAGDGNLHPHLVFDERNRPETALMHKVFKEILQACLDCGGTISGEHGIGVEKRAMMAAQYDVNTLDLFRQIKNALDPNNLSNPGKLIPVNFKDKAAPAAPADAQEAALAQELAARFENKFPSVIAGANTRLKTEAHNRISARKLDRILTIDKKNYTASVQAGVLLETLQAELAKQNVYAALPAKDKGTVGGLFASGTCPEFNRTVTGLRAALPNGRLVRYGGNFVKNAAGYPLTHLFAGSAGRLGLVTELTFKIFAEPRTAAVLSASAGQWPAPGEAIRRKLDPEDLLVPQEAGRE